MDFRTLCPLRQTPCPKQLLINIQASMEITDFVFNQREESLVVGDYNAYRAHATRKLHKLRKKLGQTTPKGRKYTAKPPVSAGDIGNNVTYVLAFFFHVCATYKSKLC